MATDPTSGVNKIIIPPAPAKPAGPGAAAAAPLPAPGAPATPGANLLDAVGDVVTGMSTIITEVANVVAQPTMAALAAATPVPVSNLAAMIMQAVRVWFKSSQVKTQAFLDANLTKFSPAGQAALKTLGAQGKLEVVDPGWNNLRDNLDGYLKRGGDVATAETVLAQLARPEGAIVQTRDHACVAAAFQLGIARDNPAQYFEMATALAGTGKAQLPGGETITVSAKNQAWIDAQNLPPGERLNAIFQAALMDYASGGGYHMESDLVTTRDTEAAMTSTMHGLRPAQARRLNDALLQVPTLDGPGLFARMATAIGYGSTPVEAATASLTAAFEEAKDDGHGGVMVVVSSGTHEIELPPGLRNHLPPEDRRIPRFHMVLVKGLADGNVVFVDPAGQTRAESLADFAKRICIDESVYVGNGGTYGTGASTSGGRPRPR